MIIKEDKYRIKVIEILLEKVQEALSIGDACDCYFELLKFIFNPEKMTEANETEKQVYQNAFKVLF
jgi:hypothetical protein